MKEIFDWLREQMRTRKGDAETRMHRLIDEDRGDRCVYSETDIEEFSANTWEDALSMLDEAEAKWEADCCEWTPNRYRKNICYTSCGYAIQYADFYQHCPKCGKRIKISEVE